jgi:hypothetical protein
LPEIIPFPSFQSLLGFGRFPGVRSRGSPVSEEVLMRVLTENLMLLAAA